MINLLINLLVDGLSFIALVNQVEVLGNKKIELTNN